MPSMRSNYKKALKKYSFQRRSFIMWSPRSSAVGRKSRLDCHNVCTMHMGVSCVDVSCKKNGGKRVLSLIRCSALFFDQNDQPKDPATNATPPPHSPLSICGAHTQEKKNRLPPPTPHPRKNWRDTIRPSPVKKAPVLQTWTRRKASQHKKYMLNTREARTENPPRNAT